VSQDLFEAAKAAQARAHAPYSNFFVGAAIRDDTGAIHAGCNIENAAYPSGWCAEPSAISHMIVAGGRKVRELLVIGNSEGPCMPCGLCRQRLLEFIDDTASVPVHLAHPERGILKTLTFADLYPHVFGADQLHS
jgi:cytidine deaminase